MNRLNLIIVLLLSLAVLLFPGEVRADINHYYISIYCNPSAGILKIVPKNIFEGEPHPVGSVSLESISNKDGKNANFSACNLGKNRYISISGIIDDDHPRNDSIALSINGRPIQNPITIASNILVSAEKEDFYVSIQECAIGAQYDIQSICVSRRVTSPSFQCNKSLNGIQNLICQSDELSGKDIQLENAYRLALHSVKNINELKSEEISWLSKVRGGCRSSAPPRGSLPGYRECIKNMYDTRIRELNSLIKK